MANRKRNARGFCVEQNGIHDILQIILDPNGRDGRKLDNMLMRSEIISSSTQQISEPAIDAYSRNTNW